MPQIIEQHIDAQNTATTTSLGGGLKGWQQSEHVQHGQPAGSRLRYTIQLIRIACVVFTADILACSISLIGVGCLAYGVFNDASLFSVLPWSIAFSILFLVQAGLYPGLGINPADELKRITSAVFLATSCSLTLSGCFLNISLVGIMCIALTAAIQWGAICAFRGLTRSYLVKFGWTIPYFLLGERRATLAVYKEMHLFGKSLLRPAGRFVFANEGNTLDRLDGLSQASDREELRFERDASYLGTPEDLRSESLKLGVSWLFVVDSPSFATPTTRQLSSIFPQVVTIHPNQFAAHRESMFCQGGVRGARFGDALKNPVSATLKRTMDFCLAGGALVALSPLFILLATLVKLSSKGPVFFSHSRLGKGGRTFQAWKFRSMVPNAQQVLSEYLQSHPELCEEWERDHKLKDDPRITWIGRILRKTSLDELPQLWNVFIGEMSLVGPRPIVKEEIAKYAETYEDYVRVVPGITGLWQISGRNNTTYEERLFFDRFYVSNWSIWLDLFILVRTVKTVLFCEGAY